MISFGSVGLPNSRDGIDSTSKDIFDVVDSMMEKRLEDIPYVNPLHGQTVIRYHQGRRDEMELYAIGLTVDKIFFCDSDFRDVYYINPSTVIGKPEYLGWMHQDVAAAVKSQVLRESLPFFKSDDAYWRAVAVALLEEQPYRDFYQVVTLQSGVRLPQKFYVIKKADHQICGQNGETIRMVDFMNLRLH